MDKMKYAADLVYSGEISYIDYVSEISAAAFDLSDGKFRPWDKDYWKMVRNAHQNGKKVVFVSGPAPVEILYAMDCVPLYLDFLPSRLSENVILTSKLISETDKRINSSLCRLNKTEIGTLLSGRMGVTPDAYVAVPIPCDSARSAYKAMEGCINAPAFHFDIPVRKSDNSLEYIEAQLAAFIDFIERLTDKKLDWDKLKYHMTLSNTAGRLLEECVSLRKSKPCPMSSHLNVWNELMSAFSPTEEIISLLNEELNILKTRISSSESPCTEGEKHRVLLLHNMLWQGLDITDWLESTYNAVTVMDGYCLKKREYFENLDNKTECIKTMCRRMLSGSTVHGAGASGEELLSIMDNVIRDYSVDVCIFMGNAGCRHEWASSKMLTDHIQDTFKMSTLMMDIDNTDRNYKSEHDIKTAIAEYMDAVVNKK